MRPFLSVPSANILQRDLCRIVMGSGDLCSPRAMQTKEVLGVSFELTAPRCRLTNLPIRRWSPSLAVGELLWHVRGDDQVDALAYYAPRWRSFADDDGFVRGSCYGARMFGSAPGERSQWENVKSLLKTDPSSRRAVINFRFEPDVSEDSVDFSCVNSLQFLVRDGKLNAFVSMRSNDVIWGVPYDLFLFTSLQELMARELGLQLGSYYHSASSMHIYERHFDMASRIAELQVEDLGETPPMMQPNALYKLARDEVMIRDHGAEVAPYSDAFSAYCLRVVTEKSIELSSAA